MKAAIEQALAGGNESARVAAVRFLADLELYRKDGDECPECARRKREEKVTPLEIDPANVIRGLEEIGLVKRSLPPEVPAAGVDELKAPHLLSSGLHRGADTCVGASADR